MIEDLWGSASFVCAVFIAIFLVGSGMPKRRHFIVLSCLLCAAVVLLSWGYNHLIFIFQLNQLVRLTLMVSNCLLVFFLSLAAVWLAFECSKWEALFCTTAGYCMQHISQRCVASIMLFVPEMNSLIEAALLIILTTAFYFLMWLFVIRKTKVDNSIADGKIQMVVSIVTLIVAICLNSFASTLITMAGARPLTVFVNIFSSLSCMLILFVEFYLIKYRGEVMQRGALESIIRQERESYKRERSAVEVINIKCHDLKHQLRILEKKIDGSELRELKDAVYAYDSVFKTGNNALDAVLYLKSMDCEAKEISITCLADGKLLNFMADSDLYSLFGNILDNAIEAVEHIEDREKRVILLNIYKTGGIINIDAANYCTGAVNFKDGLPQTTKADKDYHGFGMSSIKRIVEKYDGNLSVMVDNDEFILGIAFFG